MSQTNYVPNLGQLCHDNALRDAIHVAVAPVVAAERLAPGQRAGLTADGRLTAGGRHLGVVDPFLEAPVEEGQRCWLVLFPGTITGLRHLWHHEAFRLVRPRDVLGHLPEGEK